MRRTQAQGNGSVTAGNGFGGVRPSSGAAITDQAEVPDFIASAPLSEIAAPEDAHP